MCATGTHPRVCLGECAMRVLHCVCVGQRATPGSSCDLPGFSFSLSAGVLRLQGLCGSKLFRLFPTETSPRPLAFFWTKFCACPSLRSTAVTKHHNQKQLGEKGVDFTLPAGSPSWREVRAGTEAEATEGPHLLAYSVCFHMYPNTTCLPVWWQWRSIPHLSYTPQLPWCPQEVLW